MQPDTGELAEAAKMTWCRQNCISLCYKSVQPRRVGGPGVLNPRLLLHGVGESTPVLAQQPLPCQVANSIGIGLGPATYVSALERAWIPTAEAGRAFKK